MPAKRTKPFDGMNAWPSPDRLLAFSSDSTESGVAEDDNCLPFDFDVMTDNWKETVQSRFGLRCALLDRSTKSEVGRQLVGLDGIGRAKKRVAAVIC